MDEFLIRVGIRASGMFCCKGVEIHFFPLGVTLTELSVKLTLLEDKEKQVRRPDNRMTPITQVKDFSLNTYLYLDGKNIREFTV